MPPATPEERLADLGLAVPEPVSPAGAYRPAVAAGGLVHTSGQVPLRDGALLATGKVGAAVTTAQARECARQCGLNALAALRAQLGDLSRVSRVVKVLVFVACTPDFTEQPAVGDSVSELLRHVFGSAGEHARSAVGVTALPLDAPVEVELVVEAG
ncbi:LysR family transcriptional regulator [Prauserella coralliicola]|nr:LysR family transcriptional regulator [Prauserella coralliicola]